MKLVWIDFNGQRQPFGSISPDARRITQTFLLHAWMVTDQNDECVKVFLASEANLRVIVEDDVSQSQ